MKRFLSILLTVVMLVTMFTQTAFAASDSQRSGHQEAKVLVPEMSEDGERYYSETILYNTAGEEILLTIDMDGGILTTSTTYNGTKEIYATDLDTNMTHMQVFENDVCVEKSEFKNEAVAEARALAHENSKNRVEPYFSEDFVNIGTVTYNRNPYTDEMLELDVEARQSATYNDELFDLRKTIGEDINIVIQMIVAAAQEYGFIAVAAGASLLIQSLVNSGILVVVGIIVEGVTADWVECTGSGYRVRVTDPVSGNSQQYSGKKYKVSAEGHEKEGRVYNEDIYPQFIEEEDDKVASKLFSDFRDMGYNGVNEYYVRRKVDY